MGKKGAKKSKAVNLNDFLAAGPPSAPSGPSAFDDRSGYRPRGFEEEKKPFDKSLLPTGPRASQGPEDIDISTLPPTGPYTVFLGNLAYETQEIDIEEFFKENNVNVSTVRIPRSLDNDRIKGFGYAEFATIPDLKAAIGLSNEYILNRRVRIDLADQGGRDDMGRDGRGRDYPVSRADEDDMWRRPTGDPGFGAGDGPRGGGGFGGDRYGDRGRDDDRWGRGGGGDRYERPQRASRADEDSNWSRGEAPPPREDRGFGGSRGGGFDRDGPRGADRGFGGDRWERGGADRGGDRFGDRGGDRFGDRGGGRFGDRGGDRFGDRGGDRFGDRGGDRFGDRGGDQYGDRGGDRYGSRAGGGGDPWERGAAMPDPPPREEREPRRDDRDRGFDRYSRGRDEPETWSRGETLPPQPEREEQAQAQAPASRPKLNLARRSANADSDNTSSGPATIFGGAKPVDTAAKLAEVDEKIGTDRKYGGPRKTDTASAKSQATQPDAASTAAAPKATVPTDEEDAPPAPTNAFAGLALEDDEEDEN